MDINRREFCIGLSAGLALPVASAQETTAPVIRLDGARRGRTVPVNFTGLSYELAQLTEPDFFSPGNTALVAMLRRLSPQGVLRIGGNTSEFCWFQATPATTPITLRTPPGDMAQNWMPHRLFTITPKAVDNLAAFLKATGWQAIYGLNYGNSTPERAAVEAAYVSHALGDRLLFFQIGNEPDFYRDANNGVRPAGWGFSDYVREWVAYADAVTAKVPTARFGGPDTGASSEWVLRFGEEVAPKLGDRLVALSGHYYAEGPPNDPRVTTARLLAGDPKVTQSTTDAVRVADAHRLTYHMSEGNSCYRGGKPGMSNAFAAALWSADYLLTLASLGCGGINLHGGKSSFLSAGLGDHNPGLEALGGKAAAAPNGFYTPIATEPNSPVEARPVYYGMLFAQQFAGATMLQVDTALPEQVGLYAADKGTGLLVGLVNKSGMAHTLLLGVDSKWKHADGWSLTAPALDATRDVTLGGASVQPGTGAWQPRAKPLQLRAGRLAVSLPAASGLIVSMK